MKALRSLRGQLALIVIISIMIPVVVIGYYAVVFSRAEKSAAADAQEQVGSAGRELAPVFKGIEAAAKEEQLSRLSPAVTEILRSYPLLKVSYFNGTALYSFPTRGPFPPGPKPRETTLMVTVPDADQLAELQSLAEINPGVVTRSKDGDYMGPAKLESIVPVGNGGLLLLEARQGLFFLESHRPRLEIGASLILGMLVGIAGILWISRRLQRGIGRIQRGLEHAAGDLSYSLEAESGELGQVVDAINKMRLELAGKRELEEQLHRAERLAGLGQLVAGVAHEIRNPLGIINGTVQLMAKDLGKEPALARYEQHLKVLREQVNRQNRVVEELLSYTRPVKPQFGPVSIPGVLDSVLTFMEPSLRQGGISCEKEIDSGMPPVFGDAEKLKQVFVNLLLNCKEAMPQGGTIQITAVQEENWLLVSVKDNGPGIEEENLNRIFEPFFSTKETGTGLGLSIGKQLVEQQMGQLIAKSKPGMGTEFVVRIPLGGDPAGTHTGD